VAIILLLLLCFSTVALSATVSVSI